MYSTTNQTPISILQEVSVKNGFTIHYEFIASEGLAHEPFYIFQCRAGKVDAIGKGASKKKAKHAAAYYALLRILDEKPTTSYEENLLRNLNTAAAYLLGPDFAETSSIVSGDLDPTSSTPVQPANFVSMAQEYCDKNGWPPPIYDFAECPPSVYGGKFQCKAKLWKWEFFGYGGSKKEAKRKAAAELLKEVTEKGFSIPPEAIEEMEEANLPLVERQDLETLKDQKSNEEKAAKSAKQILSSVFNKHGRLKEIVLENLKAPSLNVYEALETILQEKRLTVFYSYVTSMKSGKIYCQAQLSTIPPQVTCSMPCEKVEEARKNAAYRCLVYLQTMTQKAPILDEQAWFGGPPSMHQV